MKILKGIYVKKLVTLQIQKWEGLVLQIWNFLSLLID